MYLIMKYLKNEFFVIFFGFNYSKLCNAIKHRQSKHQKSLKSFVYMVLAKFENKNLINN